MILAGMAEIAAEIMTLKKEKRLTDGRKNNIPTPKAGPMLPVTKSRTDGTSMTCTAMCLNGAVTNMADIQPGLLPIRWVPIWGRTVFSAAAAGAMMHATAAQRTERTWNPGAAAAVSDSALSLSRSINSFSGSRGAAPALWNEAGSREKDRADQLISGRSAVV